MNITSILTDLRQRNITVRVKGNDLSVLAEKGVLSPETRAILVNHKQAIVSYLRRLEQRDQSVTEQPLLTEAERQQVLVEWNKTAGESPKETVVELFELQADKTPEAVALQYEAQSLTYAELNAKANQLAHYLRKLGVGPETRVGICLERSLEMVLTLLGVLKAGGAYVPLDPGYPQERLQFMTEDAQVAVLISQRALVDRFSQNQAGVIYLEDVRHEIEKCSRERVASGVRVENLGYQIFTSGSTGKPKGVMVTHGNVVRLMRATDCWFGFNELDVWTMFHSYAFDFSVWELWGALLYGGRLEIIPYWVSRSPEAFYRLVKERGVTVLNQTPSAFQQFSQEDASNHGAGEDLKLRLVIFGGEALEMSSLRPWFERHGDAKPQLVNMYGITETTVHVTYKVLTKQTAQGNASVIGARIPDLQLYILDEMQPVPVGMTGEMYVGGAGVARGYWNRAELTAERFVPHPFSEGRGERLYRTGDLGRYLSDGSIEYMGRIDQQVKIRGHRIELGEIEAALEEHEAVRQAVVMAREDQPGEKRLVAYVVRKDESMELNVSRMRTYLQARLPEYMVPAALVVLESMPLTAHGKLDRKALPRPEWKTDEKKYVAPRNAVEEQMSRIWGEVLGVERVGIRDNFFELGGDSIVSIQIVARCREAGLKLGVRQLFQRQTIEQLVGVVRSVGAEDEESEGEPFSLISAEERSKLPEDVEDAYPLSRLQAGMLFHSEYNVETSLYHNISSFHLRAPLNAGVLRQAVAEVVERHEVLRTSFHASGDSQPLQWVHRGADIEVEVEDLRGLGTEAQDASLKEWMEAEKRRKFDVSLPGLLRVHIHRRTEDSFQFSLTEHHVILDGWSMASLLTELFGCYFGLLKGQWQKRKRLSSRFREFIAAEMEVVKSGEARGFWAEQLREMEIATLTWEKRPTAEAAMRSLAVPIDTDISEALNMWARQMGVSLKTVLLAAHMRVLSFISGQTDVITGITSNGRVERREGEQVLGLFLNSPPFRMQLKGGRWKDLVQETASKEAELLPYRRYPLADIQMLAGGTSLFDVSFNFVHFHVYGDLEQLDGVEVLGGDVFALTNFTLDADFSVDPVLSTLQLTLGYNSSLVGPELIQSIGGYYQNVLKHMIRYPDDRYETTSLLSEAERQQLLAEWNRTAVDYPKETFVELFERQADETPEAVAVEYADQQLTYAELNARANQLARYLHKLGVRPEGKVGIYISRSMEMVVAILGILKSGGAYVPLEPSYPSERLAYMAQDAKLELLLTQEALKNQAEQYGVKVICLDGGSSLEDFGCESAGNLGPVAQPENLVYVIYTSGSTGKPKGVAVEHRQVANQLFWAGITLSLSSADRVLQKASFSFDASILEILLPLAWGARIVIARPRGEHDVDYLIQLAIESKVTYVDLAPALLQHLLEHPSISQWKSLRVMSSGADILKPEVVKAFYQRVPGVLWNTYGPTEATVQSTFTPCIAGEHSVPIGKPIANTQTYVLDAFMQPVPIKVAGELHIGGVGVTRGYLDRPDLTAERFIPDPFSKTPGARLYRTGDMARWKADGTIEYLGRIDDQVKIRGYRIELGEVEAAIRENPNVQECVVTVYADQTGDKRLAAYFVSSASDGVQADELENALKTRLPDYMVPAYFVPLEKMPLTPNGKIDRKALPQPAYQAGSEQIPPRTVEEEILCGIWSQVLNVERVGVEDNFFKLGGHSLLATQLVSRVRKVFSVELPLRVLFETPTVAGLAEWIEHERLSAKQETIPAIRRAERAQPVPLSFAQQRLWFIDQLEPGSTAYNVPLAMRMLGKLNREALQWAVQQIVNRHEALRTRFPQQGGVPIQEIEPEVEVRIEEIDLAGVDEAKREEEAVRKAAEEAEIPFDLAHGPLVRVKLLRLAGQEHVLMVTMHHIVSDGWSTEIMVKEFCQLYEARCKGEESGLAELPIQYADFSIWQRDWLQGAVLEKELGYWKQRLDGMQALDLPTDRVRPAVMSHAGARIGFKVGRERLQDLKWLSGKYGTTLYMTCMAAWQALLYRYTGQEDIAVGSPIAGRRWTETEGLIGFFVNTLVLRAGIRGEQRFTDLLQQVRETTLEAYAHQDVPFEKVVEEIDPERDLSRTPLFQVMFTMVSRPILEVPLGEITLAPFNVESQTTKFDLSLTLTEEKEELEGSLSYKLDLFEAASIERMIGHYCMLLDAVARRFEEKIGDLPLLEEKERKQVLEDWNRTAVEYREETVVEWFELQAGKTPESVALEYEGEQLTYRELNERANQLAHYLRELGVGAEVRVGLCMERNAEIVVGLLGILKAGGVYVPLDPQYPPERLAFMLQDSDAALVLTTNEVRARLSSSLRLVSLDDEEERAKIATRSKTAVSQNVTPQNLAYLIYTSGSTGEPKAVMICHGNASAFLFWAKAHFKTALDKVLAVTSICFDLSIFEILAPLVWGGRVVLWKSVLELPSDAAMESVTLANMVPSAVRHLLAPKNLPAEVQVMNLAGEPLPLQLVQQLYRETNVREVINLYGPSETTTYSSYAYIPPESESVAIGRPIWNTQMYVLDERMNPVPVGVAGELYIGGLGVARGYLNRPGLTAERFVPDHLSGRASERFYRTGDKVRWRRDGQLEYLGRFDDQVKIRGYRIELGEIEAVLRQHPAVAQAAVIVRKEQQAERRLVGYVVGKENGVEDSSRALREYLRSRLPEYMVPGMIMELESLPLTPNGKLDRRALARITPSEQRLDTIYVAPRTPREEILASIWAELLQVERVGIHDNFFDLGGHSLLAVQVIARMRSRLGVEPTVRTLFEQPTIAQLMAKLGEADISGKVFSPPPIARRAREGHTPLSFAQQRLWFLDQLEPGNHVYHIPSTIRLTGALNERAFSAAIDEIVRRHEILRTSFPAAEGRPYQRVWPPAPVPIERIDLQNELPGSREEALQMLMEQQVQKPFDLAQGPLFRVALYTVEEEQYVICFIIHHIIWDAWSFPILVKELRILYNTFLEHGSSSLPELPLQYADVAVWEQEWLRDEVREHEVRYWREKLEGCPQVLPLATDFPRPSVQSFDAETRTFMLSLELSRELRKVCQRLGVTEFMGLLALMNVWLFRYSGQSDILIGTPVSNRTDVKTEQLIGFFLNTLIFRTQIDSTARFVDLVNQVRTNALEAYDHQSLPFEKLVDELKVVRDPSRNPLFQVMLNMGSDGNEELEFAGLVAEQTLQPASLQARFDIHLNARPSNAGLELTVTYNRGLFQPATISFMLESFAELTRLVIENPEIVISHLVARVVHFDQESALARKRADSRKQAQKLRKAQRRAALSESN